LLIAKFDVTWVAWSR